MVLRTLRVPFNMETILMVIFTVIIVDASVREKPIQILRTLATAGLIREYQLEDRKSGCTNYFPDSSCKRWKAEGLCETSGVFREKNCQKSCGFCAVCNDNQAQDNGETGIDCGGGICPACPPDSCATRDKTSRCDEIGTRFTCLTSTESRPHWPSSPCGWCPDGPCTGDNANRCEPSKWLEDKKVSGFETCYTKCKVGGRFDLVDGTTKGNCNDNELCIANGQCKVIYRFKHEGHCNGGFRGRTIQNNIVDCYNKCAEDSTVGYFAYAEKSVEKWCACYLANAGCPDDNQHNDHKAYKLLRDWELVAERMECDGREDYLRFRNIDECATACKGVATMFAFGTNDFDDDDGRCNNEGCVCLCEKSGTKQGTCEQKEHDGYRLYKYSNE